MTEKTDILGIDTAIEDESQDELGRDKFAEQIYKLITDYENWELKNGAISIGIEGKWGEGKTSLKNLVVSKFKNEKEYEIIEFESWKYKDKNDLYDNLFLEIFNKIKIEETKSNRTKEFKNSLQKAKTLKILERGKDKLISFFNAICNHYIISIIFFVIIFILPFLIPSYKCETLYYYGFYRECNYEWYKIFNFLKEKLSLIGIEFLIFIIGGSHAIYKMYNNYIDKKDFIQPLMKVSKTRYIITIDDIDRLAKDEIKELFKVIKGNLDLPNTFYILLYDEGIVSKSLAEDYCHDDNNKFIEKIINVNLKLPKVSDFKMRQFVEKYTKKNIEYYEKQAGFSDGLVYVSWQQNIAPYVYKFFLNPRDVKRFFIMFDSDYRMLSEKGGISIIGFLIIELFKIQEKELYEYIRDNMDIFCNIRDNMDIFCKKHIQTVKDRIKQKGKQDDILILIRFLFFPFLDFDDIKNINYLDLKNKVGIKQKDSFYKYFELDLHFDEWTDGEFDYLKNNDYDNFKREFEIKVREKQEWAKEEGQEMNIFSIEYFREKFIQKCKERYYIPQDINIILYIGMHECLFNFNKVTEKYYDIYGSEVARVLDGITSYNYKSYEIDNFNEKFKEIREENMPMFFKALYIECKGYAYLQIQDGDIGMVKKSIIEILEKISNNYKNDNQYKIDDSIVVIFRFLCGDSRLFMMDKWTQITESEEIKKSVVDFLDKNYKNVNLFNDTYELCVSLFIKYHIDKKNELFDFLRKNPILDKQHIRYILADDNLWDDFCKNKD